MMQQGQGLSAIGAEQQEAPGTEQGETGAQEQQEPQGITVEDVVKALMQGISPEELIKHGVPPELIKQAIQIIQQLAQAQSPQGQPQGQGLSQAGIQQGAN